MATLERALELALSAHKGQRDKAGAPYILHPLRLMMRLEEEEEEARIAAVLHDVVEDTPITLEYLRQEGFSETILETLALLTHGPELSYDAYIARLKDHPLARHIKRLDLEDNMDMRRIREPGERDFRRMARYRRVWEMLKE